MKQFFKDLFSETSDVSMTRFLAFISTISAVGIAIVGLYKNTNMDGLSMLCGTFLGIGLGSKIVQKFAEVKGEINDSKNS